MLHCHDSVILYFAETLTFAETRVGIIAEAHFVDTTNARLSILTKAECPASRI